MSKLESLFRIQVEAQLLQNNRSSPDIGEVLAVQAEAERIVEQFYQENADIVGAEDIDRARGDFELFLHLIDRTIEKRRKMEAGQE